MKIIILSILLIVGIYGFTLEIYDKANNRRANAFGMIELTHFKRDNKLAIII